MIMNMEMPVEDMPEESRRVEAGAETEPIKEKVIGKDIFNDLRSSSVERARQLVQPEEAAKYIEDEMNRTGNEWIKSFRGLVGIVNSPIDLMAMAKKIDPAKAAESAVRMKEVMETAQGLYDASRGAGMSDISEENKKRLLALLPKIIGLNSLQ